jgi:N-acetylneuraminate synthase
METLLLKGEEKHEAEARIQQTVASWGLCLPKVDPDILHFGYHDFRRFGLAEFNVNNNVEQGYCGKLMFLFAGQTCPTHHHRIKHETFFMVKGSVDMELNGEKLVLRQGHTLIINQGDRHRFTAREDSLILECSMPDLMEDSIFEDHAVNEVIRQEIERQEGS